MGYGLKPPGLWNGKKNFTWRRTEGGECSNLDLALDTWQKELGITFTQAPSTGNISVDFEVVIGGSQCCWSGGQKKLFLKGSTTLGAMLHEVGHLLGMSHEHDRPETRSAWYTKNPGFLGTKDELAGAVLRGEKLETYGDYDDESIMQYPKSKYEQKTAPSKGDVETAKAINGW